VAKDSKFWLGVGVIMIDGKEYGAEMPLPVDKLDPADLKKMEKDGRIGVKIAPVDVECAECVSHKNTIQAKDVLIVELNSEVERLKDEAKSAKKTEKKDGKK
jgi:hypothetical protein